MSLLQSGPYVIGIVVMGAGFAWLRITGPEVAVLNVFVAMVLAALGGVCVGWSIAKR